MSKTERACNKSDCKSCSNDDCIWNETPKTNADRIRAMSDEELVKAFTSFTSCFNCPINNCKVRFTMEKIGCELNWLDWLKQEAET